MRPDLYAFKASLFVIYVFNQSTGKLITNKLGSKGSMVKAKVYEPDANQIKSN
jgi:hypothetical protein